MDQNLRDRALAYHQYPSPGKIAIMPTKAMASQADLALAYSPGVAVPCEEIAADPSKAALYTSRGNMVAVITNGTAVLGLGNIGPLAAKPVMEGKAVLFKKFAGIDALDIEIDELDPDKLIEIIASLEPSFGGINLEDIKAPECFEIERRLRARMKIPVFHDDQHGTAIIVGSAVYNWAKITGRQIADIKLVTSGAGAAAIACLDLLVSMGLKSENVIMTDRAGVVYQGRNEGMDTSKDAYATNSAARTLQEAIDGADVFLGLSGPNVLKPEWLGGLKENPLILALANPTPEVDPTAARAARPDAVIATGRSDYPNQVNNVLCFPFIFRGALDVGATTINEEMKIACVKAIAQLAEAEITEIVANAYGAEGDLSFGKEYIIPKPLDPRLILEIAPAVAKAAMDTGVATRPIQDMDSYRDALQQFVFKTGMIMRSVFIQAKADPKRIVYAEGEDERVLRAVQSVLDEKLAKPILIGRPEIIDRKLELLGLRMKAGEQFEVVNPNSDPRFNDYWQTYADLMARKGVNPALAKTVVRTSATAIAALMVKKGDADGMIAGAIGKYHHSLEYVKNIIGSKQGSGTLAALSILVLSTGVFFVCDTHVNTDPTAEEIADMTILASDAVRMFGLEPKVALLSHSNFGTHQDDEACKMQKALNILHARAPALEVEGEMQADVALVEDIRERMFPNSRLKGQANLLIMPSLSAANIAYNLVRTIGEGLTIGPLLLGTDLPAHILTPSVTARGIMNATAIAAVNAQNGNATLSIKKNA